MKIAINELIFINAINEANDSLCFTLLYKENCL